LKGADKRVDPEKAQRQGRGHKCLAKKDIKLVQGPGEASIGVAEKERKGKKKAEETEIGTEEISPTEGPEMFETSKGKSLPVDDSPKVAEPEKKVETMKGPSPRPKGIEVSAFGSKSKERIPNKLYFEVSRKEVTPLAISQKEG